MTQPRIIPVKAAPNFRDLGGYAAADGKSVKFDLVFRSDDLSDLTKSDLETVRNLGLTTVVDFRDRNETIHNPDRLPAGVRDRKFLPIEAGKLMGASAGGALTASKAMGMMVSVYRALVIDYQPTFARLFSFLSDSHNLPLLFHCTAGKDRTGVAAALFLSALGVDRETVMADYLLSNDRLKNKYIAGVDYDDTLAPLYTVAPEYLDAALDIVDRQYGGMEEYLATRLGVDIGRFREMYTE